MEVLNATEYESTDRNLNSFAKGECEDFLPKNIGEVMDKQSRPTIKPAE